MEKKIFWTSSDVFSYYKSLKNGKSLVLPNVYCSENFTWNEVLKTGSKFFKTVPSLEILENIKSITDVLQKYRNILNKPIVITSSLRTTNEQEYLRKCGYKPSNTSLHLEGLAMDIVVCNIDIKFVQKFLDNVHFGEVEFGKNYTHIGLPTFSKNYLARHGLNITRLYKRLNVSGLNLTVNEKIYIIKRFFELNPNKLVQPNFDVKKNAEIF